ncbi:MAG: U32 family peptidase, partial [Muribaculaceae bacterium]|nr:U32 family peptidase [Muribaculaceae bacterium]
VQDMALLEMKLPPIALHASTQCDISGPGRARFLEQAGFSQLVLARELTLEEIKAVRKATTVPLEAFVHGALCVSYSGNCQASQVITGRSANRGECAQICRLPYDLIDGAGNRVLSGKHLLSLRDMNRLEWLGEMVDAGVDSFKIEGRLKDADYVKTVVSAYSRELDRIVSERPGLRRRSRGRVTRTFEADLDGSFNRGYTDYFLHHRRPSVSMASIDTPKAVGTPVGVVTRVAGREITVRSHVELANGDGLTFFSHTGQLQGFRVNRVEGSTLYLQSKIDGLVTGTRLFRNHDIRREAMLARTTARRVIDVDMTLRLASGGRLLALDIALAGNRSFEVTTTVPLGQPFSTARTPQHKARQETLSKLGNTVYEAH